MALSVVLIYRSVGSIVPERRVFMSLSTFRGRRFGLKMKYQTWELGFLL